MRGFILVALLLLSLVSQAQTVRLEEQELSVSGVQRRGQQLWVQLDPKVVEKTWKEYLSQRAGRVKSTKGVLTVESAVLDTISASPLRILSVTGSDNQGSYVWWNLDMGTAYVNKETTPEAYAAAEKFMRGFARKLYRDDVFRQINEAEAVLQATKNEQDRVVKEANTIQLNIEKNKQRKQELEAELARNADDLRQLEQQVQLNVQQQELSRQRVQEMERQVEQVRAKLLDIK